MDDDTVAITDDTEHDRYVLTVDGERAGELVYRPLLDAAVPTRVLLYTGIDAAYNGRGLGSRLIAAALADNRTHGRAVLPQCPFVKAYLGKHPDELDVVRAADRLAYGLPPA